MTRWLWVILLVGLAALAVGCSATDPAALTVTSADDVQRISAGEAKALLDAGEAMLYDTRSPDAYRSQRAAGSISFPEGELASRFAELSDGGEEALIFYCT